jgi:recombination protein RecR
MDPINLLSEQFKEFPGIGERQAKRFVYFLLHKNPQYVKMLGDAILSIKNQIKQCSSCYLFFQSNNDTLCPTCKNTETDKSTLLIVEKDADFESIKRSRTYKGMYFILGGLVPIVTKDTPNFVRTKELVNTIEKRAQGGVLKEVILALSINPQGEHTDMYLRELINSLKDKYNFKLSTLGRGLSTGTELEYSDSETIKNALRNRN